MTSEAGRDGDPDRVARVARDWWVTMHGAPSDAQQRRFTNWCDAHPSHRAAYDRQQIIWDRSDLLAQTKFGSARSLPRASIFRRQPAVAWTSTVAAAACLTGALVAVPQSLVPQAPARSVTIYESSAANLRTVRLSDGSIVTLDVGSRLHTAFEPSRRRLWLDAGRARFDVAQDATRPFVVNAAGATVTARGTVFDVDLTASAARVILLRGSVEIRRTTGPTRAVLVLIAGQQVVVDGTGPLATPQPAPRIEAQWPSKMIALDATSLAEAIAELNRHNHLFIALADPQLGDLRMSGAFRTDDPSGFAATAAVLFGLDVRRTESTLTLAPKSSPGAVVK